MKRMAATALILLATLGTNPEVDAAIADRDRFPYSERSYLYYFTTATVPEDQRDQLAKQLRFVCPSLSSKTYLADQFPVRVTDTLWRIDTRGLGWEWTLPYVLKKHYPYGGQQLVTRADWFVANIMDDVETPGAQYFLLYGNNPPQNAGQFLQFWGIQNDPEYVFGFIEGNSGVANERVRLLESRPGAKRNWGWVTRDSVKVAGEFDPLENLPNKARFDAQELIVAMPKWYAGQSGVLQAYFLAGADGARQAKAPANIVVDHTKVRGVEIVNSASCIYCHVEGIRPPSVDEFSRYIDSGARVFAYDKARQREIDQYLGSDVQKEIASHQQQYAEGIELCNGLKPAENTKAFIAVVQAYDAAVGLEQAAREAYREPEEVRLALGWYSSQYGLTGRLAMLAEGEAISRKQFVANYYRFVEIVNLWPGK